MLLIAAIPNVQRSPIFKLGLFCPPELLTATTMELLVSLTTVSDPRRTAVNRICLSMSLQLITAASTGAATD